MPTLNIGKVRYTWKGTYSATTAYSILDRVKDADGYVYEAIKAAPAGTELTNENYWIKLSVQGPQGLRGIRVMTGQRAIRVRHRRPFCTQSRTT